MSRSEPKEEYRGRLDRLPPDATAMPADLQRTIDARVEDLVDAADRTRAT
jgi:hypothetical protein